MTSRATANGAPSGPVPKISDKTIRSSRIRRAAEARAGLMVVAAAATSFALLAGNALPAKYFSDSRFIQSIASGNPYLEPDYSYAATAIVYRELGLANHPGLVAVISMALYVAILLLAIRDRATVRASPSTLVVMYVSVLLASIYLATYSKDTIVLAITGFVLLIARTRRGSLLIFLAMITYSLYFRSYWQAVAVIFLLAVIVFSRRKKPFRSLVLVAVCGMLVISLAVYLRDGHESLDIYRQAVNTTRIGSSDAVTVIEPYLHSGGIFDGFANALIVLFFLIIPIPLILLGSPLYLLSGGFLVFVWVKFGNSLRLLLCAEQRSTDDAGSETSRRAALRMSAVVVAFWITQAAYVPDYGSSLKHLTPMFPLLVGIMAISDGVGRSKTKEDLVGRGVVAPAHAVIARVSAPEDLADW